MHAGLEKTVCHINGSEEFAMPAVCKYLQYAGEQIAVSDGVGVQELVVIYPAGEYSWVCFGYDEGC